MSEPIVRVETRSPASGDGRQISARRYGTVELAQREADLHAAIRSVLGITARAVAEASSPGVQVGELTVAFNVAFAPDDGAYLCASSAEATFAVTLSMTVTGAGPDAGA
jgi:hypothetical protein